MTNVPLAGIEACVFDAYGTLFDFAAAARGCRDVLGADADKLTALWRDKQLQYTWLALVCRPLRGFLAGDGRGPRLRAGTARGRPPGPARAADDALPDARDISRGARRP